MLDLHLSDLTDAYLTDRGRYDELPCLSRVRALSRIDDRLPDLPILNWGCRRMSAHVRRQGNWEIRTWDDHNGAIQKRLLTCPLCEHRFGRMESRSLHFAEEHGPEDAGLSPLSADYDGQSSLASFGGDDDE